MVNLDYGPNGNICPVIAFSVIVVHEYQFMYYITCRSLLSTDNYFLYPIFKNYLFVIEKGNF